MSQQPPPYDPYRQQQQPAYNPYAQQQQPVYGQPAYAPANPYGPPPTGYAPQPTYGAPVPSYGAVPPSQPAYNPAQAFAPVAPGPYEAQGYVSPAPHTGKYQDATEHEARFVAQDGYRDWFWAVFFILHLITLFIAGFVLFGRYKDQLTKGGNDNTNNEVLTGDLYGSIIIFVIISLILCWGWLQIVQKYATQLIYFTLGLSVAIQLFFAIMLFAAGSIAGGIIFLLFAGLSLLYAYLVRTRIAFASIMLETVSKFIQMYPATIYYSIGSSLVQGVWMFVWVLTAASCLYAVDYGDSQKDPNTGKKGSTNGTVGFIYFLLLVSFFWTSQVVKNVVHVTVSGTLASWYFLYPNQMPENPTNKAFKRATTTSFGSICLGSLIIAVIKAIKAMVQQARHSNNDFARACAECLINCIDNLVQYFNLYAFTQVAIYGKTYCEAAKATWDLLKARGFAAIINDDLIGGVMALGALIGALLVGGVGVILGKFVFHYSAWGFFAVVGALIGFGMCVCAMEVVESSVASLFVCYAEDPVALRDTKPETYQRINDAFHNYYGANGPAGQ